MRNDLVCETCGGSKAVHCKRQHVKVEGTEFEEIRFYPEALNDKPRLLKAFPNPLPDGFTVGYAWKIDEAGREYLGVAPVRVGEAKVDTGMAGLDLAKLQEMAAELGVPYDKRWGKTKLIEGIEKAKEALAAANTEAVTA